MTDQDEHTAEPPRFDDVDCWLTDMDGVTVDAEAKRIDVAISEGAAQSLHVLRRLQDRDATIADFELRKPTLDDAFLALPGSSIPEPVPAMSQEDNAS